MTIAIPRLETQADKNRAKPKWSLNRQVNVSAGLRRLDLAVTRRAMELAGLNMVGVTSEDVLAVAHQARLKLVCATPQEKRASEEYLRQHGFTVRK